MISKILEILFFVTLYLRCPLKVVHSLYYNNQNAHLVQGSYFCDSFRMDDAVLISGCS